MLTDLHPPPIEPITLEEAKTFLRIDQDEENDLIGTLIRAARERLEGRLNIAMITRQMRVDLPDGGDVALPRWPVSSVDAVTVDADPTTAFTIDLRSRPVITTVALGAPVSVTFTAGYGVSADDIPAPLRQAMLLLVANAYEHRTDIPETMPLMVDALTMPYKVLGL